MHAHVEAGHHREVEGHVALVAVAEVGHQILGPLVGLGEKHPAGILLVHVAAQLLEELVGAGQVLAVGALLLVEVGDGVEAHTVDAHIQPELHRLEHSPVDGRILEVQIGLVRVEAVPVVSPSHRIPRPVALLEVLEDDPGVFVLLGRVGPDIELAGGRAGLGAAGALEPGMLVGGMVADELGDHLEAAAMGLADELAHVLDGAVRGIDLVVVGDIVAVVAQRRGVEGQQPDRGDAELLQIIKAGCEALEVADAVAVTIGEGAHVDLVDDRVFVPEWVLGRRGRQSALGGHTLPLWRARGASPPPRYAMLVGAGAPGYPRCGAAPMPPQQQPASPQAKYSKPLGSRLRRRILKICSGITCGFSST
jgi:hypothetical protein